MVVNTILAIRRIWEAFLENIGILQQHCLQCYAALRIEWRASNDILFSFLIFTSGYTDIFWLGLKYNLKSNSIFRVWHQNWLMLINAMYIILRCDSLHYIVSKKRLEYW
jgi:hypothetical protein